MNKGGAVCEQGWISREANKDGNTLYNHRGLFLFSSYRGYNFNFNSTLKAAWISNETLILAGFLAVQSEPMGGHGWRCETEGVQS